MIKSGILLSTNSDNMLSDYSAIVLIISSVSMDFNRGYYPFLPDGFISTFGVIYIIVSFSIYQVARFLGDYRILRKWDIPDTWLLS